jgi:hypothetical protein
VQTSLIKVFAIVAIFAYASSANAQNEYEKFNDPWRVYIGGYWADPSSELSINGAVRPPRPPASVEDVLGLEESKGVAWGGIGWHISRRNSLELESFTLNRDGGASGTFDPPVEVSDFFIESGAIATSYDTSLTRLTYGFSIMRSERMDFQIKAGLHIAKLEAGVQISGEICGPMTVPSSPPGCPAAGSETVSEDVTAPLPHFGASFAYAMTPSLAFSFQAVGFAIEIDSIDGSILELDADIAWQPFENFGVGAGLRYFNTNIKAGNSELNGEFDFEYIGPVLYVEARF